MGQTYVQNLAANPEVCVSNHFGMLYIKGSKQYNRAVSFL